MSCEANIHEKRSSESEYRALMSIDDAIGHFSDAERAVLNGEHNRASHIGIGNQLRSIAYSEIVSDLVALRKQIVQCLTGERD